MSPRQARRERREAERKAKKLELKKGRLAEHQPPATTSNQPEPAPPARVTPDPKLGFVSQATPAASPKRAEINRANAQFSTGPISPEGKVASSRNSTKHGLASGQIIIPGEDPAAFEALLKDLLKEHQPANPTEHLLIEEMAQSHWLAQRALRLQNDCFTAQGVNEKQLALFLRYQTTHQRTFYKALTVLLELKKESARTKRGFVSQNDPPAPPSLGSFRTADPAPESNLTDQPLKQAA